MAFEKIDIPDMFGNLANLITSGYGDPASLIEISDTGAPSKEAFGPEVGSPKQPGPDLYSEAMQMTGDHNAAMMMAGTAAQSNTMQGIADMPGKEIPTAAAAEVFEQTMIDILNNLPTAGLDQTTMEAVAEAHKDSVADAFGVSRESINSELQERRRQFEQAPGKMMPEGELR
tara:strand:- start:99 stop:617 length:519 start_codon:yes stop_codon:yes gene_type:complete